MKERNISSSASYHHSLAQLSHSDLHPTIFFIVPPCFLKSCSSKLLLRSKSERTARNRSSGFGAAQWPNPRLQFLQQVKQEMDQSHNINQQTITQVGPTRLYTISKYREPKNTYLVGYNIDEDTYPCSCQNFESKGWPCHHQIHVLKQRNLEKLPDSLILNRWTRNSKATLNVDEEATLPEIYAMARFGSLASISNTINHKGKQNAELYNQTRIAFMKILDDMFSAENVAKNTETNNVIRNPVRDPRNKWWSKTKEKKSCKKKGGSSKGITQEGGQSGTAQTTMDADNDDSNEREATAEDGVGTSLQPVPSRSNTKGGNQTSSNPPRATKETTIRKCGICRNPGHTKNRCPQNIVHSVIHDHSQVDDTSQGPWR